MNNMLADRILKKIQEARQVTQLSYDDFLSFNSMLEFEVGGEYMIGNIQTKVLAKTDDYIKFRTIMEEGQILDQHWHDCLERVSVHSGNLRCSIDDNVNLIPGDKIDLPAFRIHGPYNAGKETVKLTVEFFKNKRT
jgi:uncharacterized RmlC-like cupin family protein